MAIKAIASAKIAQILNKEMPAKIGYCFERATATTRPACWLDSNIRYNSKGQPITGIISIYYKADCYAFPRDLDDGEIQRIARRAGGDYGRFIEELADEIAI